jgi:predicted hydrocarbon binding protein
MIDNLNITGEDLVRHYTRTGGKRGWAFDEVEIIDGKRGIFLCKAYYSPFVIRFSGKSHVCVCDFLAGAFEAMCHAGGFRNMRIIETKCMAKGDEICVFENMKV